MHFIETMDCRPVAKIPHGEDWTCEIKLEGYRLEAVKNGGKVTVYSRRKNILNEKFGYIAQALVDLPEGTILDGELVALELERHCQLQPAAKLEFGPRADPLFFAFDVLARKVKSLLENPLSERREIP